MILLQIASETDVTSLKKYLLNIIAQRRKGNKDMTWQVAKFNLLAEAPVILHNGELANPTNPIVAQQKKISGKRSKTLADHERMAELEFKGSLYVSEELGIIIPSDNIEAVIIKGAMKFKEGPLAKSGMYIEDHAKLIYDGPQDPDSLWEDKSFVFQKMVTIQRNRILRTRPIFHNWSAAIEVHYQNDIIDIVQIEKWLKVAGEQVGLCDWRPRYGRFRVESF
jgi:hypothetical protein